MTNTPSEEYTRMMRRLFRISGRRGWTVLGVLAVVVVCLTTQTLAIQGQIPQQLKINNAAVKAAIDAARRRAVEGDAQTPAPQRVSPPDALVIPIDLLGGGSRSLPEAAAAAPHDPAFGRLVDLDALGRAWDTLDAVGIADGALALIEGERVLRRQHAGLSGADVAAVAARLAVERSDGETLARLEKAAARSGDPKLVERLAAVKLLGGKTRAAVPVAAIDAGTVTPEQYGSIVAVSRAALRARVTGNAAYILPLVDEDGDIQFPVGVPASIQATLGERVAALCDGLPEEPAASTGMLDVLAAESRCGQAQEGRAEQPVDVSSGFG